MRFVFFPKNIQNKINKDIYLSRSTGKLDENISRLFWWWHVMLDHYYRENILDLEKCVDTFDTFNWKTKVHFIQSVPCWWSWSDPLIRPLETHFDTSAGGSRSCHEVNTFYWILVLAVSSIYPRPGIAWATNTGWRITKGLDFRLCHDRAVSYYALVGLIYTTPPNIAI